jgi:hypothetical protein
MRETKKRIVSSCFRGVVGAVLKKDLSKVDAVVISVCTISSRDDVENKRMGWGFFFVCETMEATIDWNSQRTASLYMFSIDILTALPPKHDPRTGRETP